MTNTKRARRHILYLTRGLAKTGADTITVNLANSIDREKFKIHFAVQIDGILRTTLPPDTNTRIMRKDRVIDFHYLKELVTLIRKWEIHLIHAHSFGNNLYGFLAAMLTGTKIIQTIHGRDCLDHRRRIQAYRLMKKGVDRLVVVSDELEREVRERIGLTPPKLCCVYNGVDTDYYSGHKNGEYRMPLEGLNGGGPVIGTVGNIRHIKGHDIFLHTARLLVNRYPEAKFVVVGDTFPKNREYRNYLLGLKRELGLDRNVEFAGSVHDTSEVFPLFDIFVLPSRSEGLSLSLLEAMSSERPIVATAVGGNSKLIEHGKTGFLAPPEDAETLSKRITELIERPDAARQMGKSARKTVSENFSLRAMARQYEEMYEAVLGSRNKA